MTRCAQRTELANEDLRAIALQIGLESGRVVTGARIIDELIDCCDRIAALPVGMVLGSAAPELGTGVRLFHHRRWVLIFRYLDTGILVLRIVDGSQDYSSWKLDQ